MSLYSEYSFHQKVMFIDEDQCEIRGRVIDKKDYPDRLVLTIELDDGGYYDAHLMRRSYEENNIV